MRQNFELSKEGKLRGATLLQASQHFPLKLRGAVLKAGEALIFKVNSCPLLLALPRGSVEESQQEKKNLPAVESVAWTSPIAHIVTSAAS